MSELESASDGIEDAQAERLRVQPTGRPPGGRGSVGLGCADDC
ncbi:hypothetical protein ACWDZ4_14120 [Streptomyces sp. NPDC003016]